MLRLAILFSSEEESERLPSSSAKMFRNSRLSLLLTALRIELLRLFAFVCECSREKSAVRLRLELFEISVEAVSVNLLH